MIVARCSTQGQSGGIAGIGIGGRLVREADDVDLVGRGLLGSGRHAGRGSPDGASIRPPCLAMRRARLALEGFEGLFLALRGSRG